MSQLSVPSQQGLIDGQCYTVLGGASGGPLGEFVLP